MLSAIVRFWLSPAHEEYVRILVPDFQVREWVVRLDSGTLVQAAEGFGWGYARGGCPGSGEERSGTEPVYGWSKLGTFRLKCARVGSNLNRQLSPSSYSPQLLVVVACDWHVKRTTGIRIRARDGKIFSPSTDSRTWPLLMISGHRNTAIINP